MRRPNTTFSSPSSTPARAACPRLWPPTSVPSRRIPIPPISTGSWPTRSRAATASTTRCVHATARLRARSGRPPDPAVSSAQLHRIQPRPHAPAVEALLRGRRPVQPIDEQAALSALPGRISDSGRPADALLERGVADRARSGLTSAPASAMANALPAARIGPIEAERVPCARRWSSIPATSGSTAHWPARFASDRRDRAGGGRALPRGARTQIPVDHATLDRPEPTLIWPSTTSKVRHRRRFVQVEKRTIPRGSTQFVRATGLPARVRGAALRTRRHERFERALEVEPRGAPGRLLPGHRRGVARVTRTAAHSRPSSGFRRSTSTTRRRAPSSRQSYERRVATSTRAPWRRSRRCAGRRSHRAIARALPGHAARQGRRLRRGDRRATSRACSTEDARRRRDASTTSAWSTARRSRVEEAIVQYMQRALEHQPRQRQRAQLHRLHLGRAGVSLDEAETADQARDRAASRRRLHRRQPRLGLLHARAPPRRGR